MPFNNVPVNGWPQIKDLEKLDAIAEQIEGMPTFSSSDRDWLDKWERKLPELPEDPETDGVKILTATTENGETVKSWEELAGGNSIVYSTEEREIGEYFGKKLYEKSYVLFENGVAQYTVTNNEYQIGMTGYDDAFVAGIIGVRSDAGDVYVDSGQSGAEVVVVFNKTDGSIYFTSGHAYTSFIAVVRYTKQSV